MFGSLGVPELLLIFVVILIVFGPRRIPEIGRTLGKALGEFRKATDDLKSTIEREVRLEELKKVTPPSLESFMTPSESVSRTEPLPPPVPETVVPESTVEQTSIPATVTSGPETTSPELQLASVDPSETRTAE
jgi:TatA/E family protein of Tat protein translocase